MITHMTGEFIGLSWGEYSDYSFHGLYRTLADIDLADCAARYADGKTYGKSSHGFGAWLIAHELVTEIDYDEVHCGAYGDFDVKNVIAYANNRGAEIARKGG